MVDTAEGEERIYLFDSKGKYKFRLQYTVSNPNDQLKQPARVKVTSKGHLIITDRSPFVKIFQADGSFLQSFSTVSPEDGTPPVKTCGLAVTHMDDIIVGDTRRRVVTVHTQINNWAPRKINATAAPDYLATNSQRQILMCDWEDARVDVVSFEGKFLFKIEFNVDDLKRQPRGLVCGKNDDIFISVAKMASSDGNRVYTNSGQIQQFNCKGVFLGCIIKKLFNPRSVALSESGLMVIADSKSVVIYSSSLS